MRLANFIAKVKGWDREYHSWGEEKISIEERLKELLEEIIKELLETLVNLKLSPQILEDIRKSFCEIRKGMVLAETPEQLERLKNQSNLIVAITHFPDFKERFSETMKEIEELVKKEEERTVNYPASKMRDFGWVYTLFGVPYHHRQVHIPPTPTYTPIQGYSEATPFQLKKYP